MSASKTFNRDKKTYPDAAVLQLLATMTKDIVVLRTWQAVKFALVLTILITYWQGLAEAALVDSHPLPNLSKASRFISYTPRGFSIVAGKVVAATESGITEDLKLLRPFFDGIITYASTNGIETVPMVASNLGFRAIIMGIWDPSSETEIKNVILATKKYPTLISAVIVGNEGIYSKRYLPEAVQKTIQRLKKECPSLPSTTSEPFSLYFQKDLTDFFSSHDLLMPNVHPVFEKWFSPSAPMNGVEMVIKVAEQFIEHYEKPLLIKETGMPSGQESHGFSVERQALFWTGLFKRFPVSKTNSFACFEAFDAPWKPAEMTRILPGEHANEAFWGFFTASGKGKRVLDALPRLIKSNAPPK